MNLVFPKWSLENATQNGSLQCGYCGMMMGVEGKGKYGSLEFGLFHHHHTQCPKHVLQDEWETLPLIDKPDDTLYTI
jgi:hypothetical protein